MKLLLIAIRDQKSMLFSQPMYFTSKPVAVRAFGDAVKDASGDYCKHPEDYSLYYLGEYEDSTGLVSAVVEPEFLIQAINLIVEGRGL